MLALGVDVGVRKGLDLVVLDERRQIATSDRRVDLDGLGRAVEELRPDVVAIDSPPGWARPGNRSRATDRALAGVRIRGFAVPSEDLGATNPFYRWMTVGFEAFRVAASRGYERYVRGSAWGTAIEVFPNASAIALAGRLPPPGSARKPGRKREWRRRVLEAQGVATASLRSLDQIDAALAALTGLVALVGRFVAPGDPEEGVIVLPIPSLPPCPYETGGEEVGTP